MAQGTAGETPRLSYLSVPAGDICWPGPGVMVMTSEELDTERVGDV